MNLTIANRRLIILFLVLAALAVSVILMARGGGGSGPVDSWQTDYSPTTKAPPHTLADVRSSSHMNVTVYDAGGQPGYLGWSGGSETMAAFIDAVTGASAVAGEPDESFADLIVFYFKNGDSMELTFSRQRDLLMFGGQLYQPAGEITPLIVAGEERFN